MENEITQEKNKNQRFDKAVEISVQLFLERGIDDVKMTDIAEKAGSVSPRSIAISAQRPA